MDGGVFWPPFMERCVTLANPTMCVALPNVGNRIVYVRLFFVEEQQGTRFCTDPPSRRIRSCVTTSSAAWHSREVRSVVCAGMPCGTGKTAVSHCIA
jgi:hypothetical protein